MTRARCLTAAANNKSWLGPARTGALLGVLFSLCVGSGCGLPPGLDEAETEPAVAPVAQSARVPQATRVDPATVFAGATPLLTVTGRNFVPELRVSIDGTVVPLVKLISSTQAQVQLPASINTLGKKLLRVENPMTFRGSERDDLLTLTQDPVALLPLEQSLDNENAKLVASGDVNGDSKPDVLLLSSDGNTLHLYLSGGRAPLQPAPPLSIYGGTATLALGDVNGDGKLDVMTVTGTYLQTNLGDGTGKFTLTTNLYDSRFSSIDSLQGNLAIADLNGDGKADVCFGTRNGELAYVAGKGDGTFASTGGATVWRSPGWPILQVRVADVNGDSKLDLIAVGGGDAVFPATGKQGGLAVIPLQTGTTPAASYTYSTAALVTAATTGDFNGDGKLDVAAATADGRIVVYAGSGDGKFPSLRSTTASTNSGLLFSADWNRDGKLDLLLSGRAPGTSFPVGLSHFLGAGDGTFGAAVRSNLARASFASAVLVDLDQDLKLDVVGVDGTSGRVLVSFGRGDGTMLASPDYGLLWRDAVATGDFNGDGIVDLASASVISTAGSIALGLGDGGFKAGSGTLSFDKGPSALATGDFNRDGKLDLAAANYDSAVVSLLLGNGDGTTANQRTFSVDKTPNALAAGDLNGDGLLDLVTANADADTVSVLIGNGTGNFATSKEYATGKNPVAMVMADFNGDGRLDVVTANADGNNVSYLQGSAAVAGALNTARAIAACPSPASLAAVDVNGDSKLDLVTACSDSGEVAFLLGKGDGTFNPAKTVSTCDFPLDVQLADVSGDGKLDLAVACGSQKRLQMFVQVGDLAFSLSPHSYEVGRGYFVGDLNGDRKADILLTESPLYPLLLLNISR